MISLEEFHALPTDEAASLVRQAGPQVCVFPINGTRRWAVLEHGEELAKSSNPAKTYMDLAAAEYIRLYRLLFNHGLDTIVSPQFGSELLSRGKEYVDGTLGQNGIVRMFKSAEFLDFYRSLSVRVRVYGNYRNGLAYLNHAQLITLFDKVARQTKSQSPYRLFYGVFADNATQLLADLIALYTSANSGFSPDSHTLTTLLYGEVVEPATLFIGFDKPAVFDYPLLSNGQEHLYFTYAPSPYLDQTTLRNILYDHLYLRCNTEPSWERLPAKQLERLGEFYRNNRRNVLGVGKVIPFGEFEVWVPER